ncbi:MAG: hypothetical protein ACKN9E_13250 [Microcystaceae cyanobacterium]
MSSRRNLQQISCWARELLKVGQVITLKAVSQPRGYPTRHFAKWQLFQEIFLIDAMKE